MSIKTKISERGRMNAVDVLILLCVLVFVLILVYMMFFSDMNLFGNKDGTYDSRVVRCTLRVEPVDNDLLSNDSLPISTGDLFYHVTGEYALGSVTEVSEKQPYLIASTRETQGDTLLYGEHPAKSKFVITVEANVVMENGAYYINDNAVRVGDTFVFATPYFTGTCVCDSIQEVNE